MTISTDTTTPRSWGEGCLTWELLAGKDLAVFHERMPPGTEEVRHYHQRAQQFFFVLTGQLRIELDGVIHELSQHEGVAVDPGIAHQVRNASPEPAEFLVISSPNTSGDRIAVPDSDTAS
jgi:mannose-6-phosphate isomerase-like protein (cupin superfamily)